MFTNRKIAIKVTKLLILFMFFGLTVSQAQVAKMKAVFIYNFTKYIEWPASYKSGSFVITVLGKSPMFDELKKMSTTRSVGNQKIEVKNIQTLGELTKCHILFVSETNSAQFQSIIAKIGNGSTLIITEKNGMALQGSAINFVNIGNNQKYELNKKNLTNRGLQVNSTLENYAILVE